MLGGYMGRILRVNLWRNKYYIEPLPPETVLRSWIGGRGLGVYLALKEIDPKADPLGPRNKAFVMTGPITGVAGVPESGRWCSVTKSPLTDTIHDSQSGGKFGPELKFAGFDAVILEDVSEKPVYLWIHDGKVEIRDATHLWGKDVHATTDIIQEELAPEIGRDEAKKIKVLAIGPAGENLVRFAALINDKSRAAGRGGHGAVWGSKKIKAIAVRGHMKPKVAKEEVFKEVVAKMVKKHRESPVTSEGLPKLGTAILVNIINKAGIFPTRNFRTGVFEGAEKISGETLAEKYLDKKKSIEESCWGCVITCARYTKIKNSPFSGEGGGPEYETIWAFGAQTGTDNLEAISKANFLCNELGLDTISMGHTIGTLMELVEMGKIPPEKLRGLNVKWGSPEAIVELVWRTAYRSGIGDELAEGSWRLANKYGAPEVSMSVRKQELPAYDPRGAQGHGLAYATSNRGGCHLRAYMISPEVLGVPSLVDRFSTKGKPALVKEFQDVFAVIDSMVVCKFSSFAIWDEDYAEIISAVTGWDISKEEVHRIGERIYNAERAFNVLSFGDGREYDTLPKRLLEEPMPEGPAKGHVVRLNEMLDEYYKLRGWIDGRPTRAKLEELGLKWVADRLEEEGLLPG
ncbi:aldehyde ferredoxin oxidoreductase [Staphylothermus marinus F1]|uniref:Aldehyde ferredoxin oxidoreductase n=2 Tax=Staphylothermus marinus TaxID=2280 RepID=A3DMB4_STAMF|nr:aldehyde ferredoxin oxidoreductase [Staphylothermus marinus F1]